MNGWEHIMCVALFGQKMVGVYKVDGLRGWVKIGGW